MTEDELREIEARANAATPGPWAIGAKSNMYHGYVYENSDGVEFLAEVACGMGRGYGDDNAKFVAHAREDIPALIAEVRRFHKIRSMLHVIVRRGIVQYCPFCSSDVRENHSGFCEMFTPEGELK